MSTRVEPINWREEFEQLAPYLNGQGGIVRICFPSRRCALPKFLDTIEWAFESKTGNSAWCSIKIDAEDYNVRYLEGVRDVFCRKLKISLDDRDKHGEPSLSILQGAEAEEIDLDVRNVLVGTFDTVRALHESRSRWVASLCEYLTTFLPVNHLMVLVNHGMPKEQDEFWRFLWSDGLEKLVNLGLFLVHVVDTSDTAPLIHHRAPIPDGEVHLPTALSRTSQRYATADVKQWFQRRCPRMPEERAEIIAETLVGTHLADIERLHMQCAAQLTKYAQQFG